MEIVLLPLLSALISGLGGRYIGEKGAMIGTTLLIIITALLSWMNLYEIMETNVPKYIHLWNWIESGSLQINMGLQFDSITIVMLTLVTTVSALVHLYSTEYMSGDPHVPRFMSYLSLFTFFMIVLVTADNFVQLFIGWEGVGLCSYLLINFWFTRIQANKSAMKAMIVNRIGDIGVSLGLFAIFYVFKSLDFSTVFGMINEMKNETIIILTYEFHALTLISILLFIGAIGKSAQLGLHTWLPDAMEGPTPVSALIHAATMVTAGVFLLIRSSPILEYAPNALFIIVIIGSLTALFAATIGLVQNDIKKVIAYSTCSQLGYMVFACGLSNYSVSLFHLFNHGFFKALLFLSAGSVIHAMMDEQDMRKLGGLIRSLPFTYSMMLIGSLSLMGFPFLTGYYSKDAILELSFANFSVNGLFSFWLGTIAALFTAFYSFRLIYLTFISNTNSSQKVWKASHESGYRMSIPLFILAFGSIFIGYIFRDLFIGFGTPFFNNSIFFLHTDSFVTGEFLPVYIKFLPVILSLIGAFSAFILYHSFIYLFTLYKFQSLYIFLNNKWHFDFIYNTFFAKPLLQFGHTISYKLFDRGFFELLGPLGISQSVSIISSSSKNLQTGFIYHYAFTIFLFSTIFILFVGPLPLSDLLISLISFLFISLL
jgi:proton-translocating NADH-quinone oxidoreductase chain L